MKIRKGFITATGINYSGTLPKIRKNPNQLQPIYEAVTNALEALKLLKDKYNIEIKGEVIIKLILSKNLFSKEDDTYNFNEIVIEDNGLGFEDSEFERFIALNDCGKGFSNKGSGRIQFLHFFDKTVFKSVFRDSSSPTGYRQKEFTLSKSKPYLDKNSIINLKEDEEIKSNKSYTVLSLKNPLSEKDESFLKSLTTNEIKENIISHYLAYFCENRNQLPEFTIQQIVDNELKENIKIVSDDIPTPDNQKDIDIYYCKMSIEDKSIQKTDNKEMLNLKSFKISKNKLQKNGLKLTSKGEIAKEIKLESLLSDDFIEDNRYLFLLSGEYIDKCDTDTRGDLNIPTKEEFKKNYTETLFNEEVILLDEIQEKANRVIENLYDEIKTKRDNKLDDIQKLKSMFLLSDETLNSIKIGLNDSDDKILEKVYQADAKLVANKDAIMKQHIQQIENLNPAEEDYEENLRVQVDELVKTMPLQNKAALTHYVARRKLVLELFDKILKKQLEIQKTNKRNIDEKLLHNLIFQQSSDNPEKSDLWLINEDFIYFRGKSEGQLNQIEIDSKKIFKQDFTKEEEEYLHSLGENRKIKKPDVLLFPAEGKCIIIEFKNPDVNVGVHLNQINRYASLIRNFSEEGLQIDTFYGYLIGEGITAREVKSFDGDFKASYQFDYLFRPSKTIPGENRSDGSLYTEVIKYTTLLDRAILRNKLFIEKLTK
ncbi:ATP-binding protein [Maribellus comscasis]|uniref:ATP-binding protein n=1 Tax=Maribellus comscasis TaxID=2681766 RepID=A0A6I6K0F7_9BACT|nr:ATP-binding protein [Maribellus comscasis]QGY45892.1 ATP-binding protein [Maribellus comscasis]